MRLRSSAIASRCSLIGARSWMKTWCTPSLARLLKSSTHWSTEPTKSDLSVSGCTDASSGPLQRKTMDMTENLVQQPMRLLGRGSGPEILSPDQSPELWTNSRKFSLEEERGLGVELDVASRW